MSFDAVLIANALHVMPEPERALSEIDRGPQLYQYVGGGYRGKGREHPASESEGTVMSQLRKDSVQHTLSMPLCGRMIAARKYPDLFPDRDAEHIVRVTERDYIDGYLKGGYQKRGLPGCLS